MNKNNAKSNKKAETIGLIIFLLIGIGLLLGATASFAHSNNFLKNGVQTEAVILDINTGHGSENSTDAIFIEYEANGEKRTKTIFMSLGDIKIGDSIPIRYLKDDPDSIIYDNNLFSAFYILLFTGIAVVLFSASRGIYLLIKSRKISK